MFGDQGYSVQEKIAPLLLMTSESRWVAAQV